VQQPAGRGLVDILGDRYQLGTAFLDGQSYHDVVVHVPGQAVYLVDDDVVELSLLAEVAQKPLQGGPRRRAGALAAVCVFPNDRCAQAFRLVPARLPLGGYGNPSRFVLTLVAWSTVDTLIYMTTFISAPTFCYWFLDAMGEWRRQRC